MEKRRVQEILCVCNAWYAYALNASDSASVVDDVAIYLHEYNQKAMTAISRYSFGLVARWEFVADDRLFFFDDQVGRFVDVDFFEAWRAYR